MSCSDSPEPVCGSDGETYLNSCYAVNAGVTSTPGKCLHHLTDWGTDETAGTASPEDLSPADRSRNQPEPPAQTAQAGSGPGKGFPWAWAALAAVGAGIFLQARKNETPEGHLRDAELEVRRAESVVFAPNGVLEDWVSITASARAFYAHQASGYTPETGMFWHDLEQRLLRARASVGERIRRHFS